jgi:hypothetical protein
MDRRTFIKAAAAVPALELLGPIASLALRRTNGWTWRDTTCLCATLFNGSLWVVLADEPNVIYRVEERDLWPGDLVVIAREEASGRSDSEVPLSVR